MNSHATPPAIAIYGSKRQQPYLKQIQAFLDTADALDAPVMMHVKLYNHLLEHLAALPQCVSPVYPGDAVEADIALSLGGDGTFLRTVQWTQSHPMPVLGVNAGHLGYLAALDIDELPALYGLLASDAFRTERRNMLRVVSPALPDSVGCIALNEIAISKEETASMINTTVQLNGELLAHYRADGLIVSTATGSTAYNLSVGGPIVQPTVHAWTISPVAAHSLAIRPLVVDADSCISIIPTGRSPHVRLALDGRSALLDTGTEIKLERAPSELTLMLRRGRSFADTLRNKLHWAED